MENNSNNKNIKFKARQKRIVKHIAYIDKDKLTIYQVQEYKSSIEFKEISLINKNPNKFQSSDIEKLKKLPIKKLDLIFSREFFINEISILPASNPEEAEQMAIYKLPKLSPHPISNAIAKVKIIETNKDGYTTVNLWILDKKKAYDYLYVFTKAGIPISNIILEIDGLSEWTYLSESNVVIIKEKNICIFLISKNNTELFIKKLHLSEENSTQQENTIKNETNKLYEYIRNEYPDIDINNSVVIADNEKDLEILKNILNPKKALLLTNILKESNISTQAPITATISYLNSKLNFLPNDYKKEIEKLEIFNIAFKISIYAVLYFISLSVFFFILYISKTAHIKKLSNTLKKTELKSNSLKHLRKSIITANTIEKNKYAVFDSLSRIIPIVKGTIKISEFSFYTTNEKTIIEITGYANSFKEIIKFLTKLQKIELFKNAQSKYMTKDKLKGKNIVRFKITTIYNNSRINNESKN